MRCNIFTNKKINFTVDLIVPRITLGCGKLTETEHSEERNLGIQILDINFAFNYCNYDYGHTLTICVFGFGIEFWWAKL